MKKVLFVLAVVLLTACGSATAPAVTADTVVRQDSLNGIPVVDAEKKVDTAKEIK